MEEKSPRNQSQIFAPFRAVGYVTNHVPFNLEVRGSEHFVTTVVGSSFHLYNAGKLTLQFVGEALPDEINVITSIKKTQIVAAGCNVYLFERGKTKRKYIEHSWEVNLLLALGEHVISVDSSNTVCVWEHVTLETYLSLCLDKENFSVSAAVHPSTYLNKILFASKQGSMQLWNIRTSTLVYEFAGWKSQVNVLEQAPAVDVIAVGLENGQIKLHNIKFDKTLMSFNQEFGSVTSLSFRTDGTPIMVSGSVCGRISMWNLEKKQMAGVINDAHTQSVTGMKFYHKQPLLVTSSPDNSLKIWVFDNPDGSGRLLKQRSGHAAPPTRTLFYGSYGNVVLSSGVDQTLRHTAIMRGEQCSEFSQGSLEKDANRKGVDVKSLRLPPITDIAAETSREFDWDNIVTCHLGYPVARSWSAAKRAIGSHELGSRSTKHIPTCCDVTSCGNFTVIGYNSGHMVRFNLQSGAKRVTYGKPFGDKASIRSVCVDNANMMLISASADKTIRFWKFKDGKLLNTITCDCPIASTKLHRESSLLAVCYDNFTIEVIDIDTQKMVRRFAGHSNLITAMSWSSDARWLVTSSVDGSIKTWDVPSARLVDCFLLDFPASSVSLSPTSEFLATTHQDHVGIYLWSNKVIYSGNYPAPLPNDYEPQSIALPTSHETKEAIDCEDEEEEISEDTKESEDYLSPDQLSDFVITLSLLPESRWKSLTCLDLIKSRNKPKQPPKKAKAAPFFLPTIAGLETTFDTTQNQDDEEDVYSKISTVKNFENDSSHQSALRKFQDNPEDHKLVEEILDHLKQLSPAQTDVEFRVLSPDAGGDMQLMVLQLKFFTHALKLGKDYEMVQAYIALFTKLHGDTMMASDELREASSELLSAMKQSWSQCDRYIQQSICLVKYFKNATI